MPCYEVRTVSVEFKAVNRTILENAIKALGWVVRASNAQRLVVDTRTGVEMTIDLQGDQATLRGYDGQRKLNELKREHSKQVVKTAAKKVGWSVKWNAKEKATVKKMQW